MKITLDNASQIMALAERVLLKHGAFEFPDDRGNEKTSSVKSMTTEDLVLRLVVDENVTFDEASPVCNDIALGMWMRGLANARAPLPNRVMYPVFPVRAQFLGGSEGETRWWVPLHKNDPRTPKAK